MLDEEISKTKMGVTQMAYVNVRISGPDLASPPMILE